MKKIIILGATGSIGKNSLELIRNMQEKFNIVGLTANLNKNQLLKSSQEFNCKYSLTSEEGLEGIKKLIIDTNPDIVINGIAGSAGLLPSKIVLEQGIDLALANKETVVMAYSLIHKLAIDHRANILPVDSEHSAIFNLIQKMGTNNVTEIILTASGGPFLSFSPDELTSVAPEDALKHPTWNMGSKITIDSATLANKGLEVIEACKLFSRKPSEVKVLVHPQSLIHSIVRTTDGMLYAQISNPDMKHPILSALTWPEYSSNPLKKFNLFDKSMTFFKPRTKDFPLLSYAYQAAELEGSYTIAYNAADEIAALAFLDKRIGFTDISKIVYEVLQQDWSLKPDSFNAVFEQHNKAKKIAGELICK